MKSNAVGEVLITCASGRSLRLSCRSDLHQDVIHGMHYRHERALEANTLSRQVAAQLRRPWRRQDFNENLSQVLTATV